VNHSAPTPTLRHMGRGWFLRQAWLSAIDGTIGQTDFMDFMDFMDFNVTGQLAKGASGC